MSSPEPILDLAKGDLGESRSLARALRIIADVTHDPAMKRQIGEILAGRGSVRDFAASEPFTQMQDRIIPLAMQKYEQMPESERERLAEQGRAELEQLRHEPCVLVPQPNPHSTARDQEAGAPPEPRPSTASARNIVQKDHVHPGTRRPNRERVVTPDEPDDDDLYFQERRQRGYLT